MKSSTSVAMLASYITMTCSLPPLSSAPNVHRAATPVASTSPLALARAGVVHSRSVDRHSLKSLVAVAASSSHRVDTKATSSAPKKASVVV
jgi:hypothetical protein